MNEIKDYVVYPDNIEIYTPPTMPAKQNRFYKNLVYVVSAAVSKVCIRKGSKIEKIAEPENYTAETEILVRRTDIDWNNHVHNLTYLDYALDCLPEDVYTNKNFKKVRITFKHEISGRKIIKGKYGETENASVVAIHNEKGDLCTLVEFKE